MKAWLAWFAMAGMTQEAAPPPRLDCLELRALVVAARTTPSFANFPDSERRGPMLGLGAWCYRHSASGVALYCQLLRAGGLRREEIAGQIAACLPEAGSDAAAQPGLPRRYPFDGGASYFRVNDVSIRLSNSASRTIIGYQLYLRIRHGAAETD